MENKNIEEDKSISNGKTDMRYLLIPWIVFWIAANIHVFWGSLISIFICCLLPLLFYKNKKTIYDIFSIALVSVFSMLLLINLPVVMCFG